MPMYRSLPAGTMVVVTTLARTAPHQVDAFFEQTNLANGILGIQDGLGVEHVRIKPGKVAGIIGGSVRCPGDQKGFLRQKALFIECLYSSSMPADKWDFLRKRSPRKFRAECRWRHRWPIVLDKIGIRDVMKMDVAVHLAWMNCPGVTGISAYPRHHRFVSRSDVVMSSNCHKAKAMNFAAFYPSELYVVPANAGTHNHRML